MKQPLQTYFANRSVLLAALLLVGLAVVQPALQAGPASPFPFVFTQPDGTQVTLRLRGDEHFRWHEDTGGFTVVEDGDKFVYAKLDAQGRLAPTTLLAGRDNPKNASLTPGLLPSPAVISQLSAHLSDAAPPVTSLRDFSTNNVVKNLVLLAKFSNHNTNAHGRPPGDYFTLFNTVGGAPLVAPTGSVRDYFYTNSYGKLVITSTVFGWFNLPQNLAYYGNGNNGLSATYPSNSQGMAEAALDAAVAAGVDFGPFDADNDGYVDALNVICSGVGGDYSGNGSQAIWPVAWSLPTDYLTGSTNALGQPVKVKNFLTVAGLYGQLPSTNITHLGVICHENGHHIFGLPDLYELASGLGASGIGSYCLMANSWGWDGDQLRPPHFSAWCRSKIGWTAPKPVDFGATTTANQIQTSNEVWKVTNGFPAGEYLLIENRQPVGHWETSLPQGGLCIWHIDEAKTGSGQRGWPGQGAWPGNGNHFKVALLQADGNYDLEARVNGGDAGDVYHAGGISHIGPSTLPSTDTYQGGVVQSSGNIITNISASGPAMTFQGFNTNIIYVDKFSVAPSPDGSFAKPFLTVAQGYNAADSVRRYMVIKAAGYTESVHMTKTLRIDSTNGTTRIGP